MVQTGECGVKFVDPQETGHLAQEIFFFFFLRKEGRAKERKRELSYCILLYRRDVKRKTNDKDMKEQECRTTEVVWAGGIKELLDRQRAGVEV